MKKNQSPIDQDIDSFFRKIHFNWAVAILALVAGFAFGIKSGWTVGALVAGGFWVVASWVAKPLAKKGIKSTLSAMTKT